MILTKSNGFSDESISMASGDAVLSQFDELRREGLVLHGALSKAKDKEAKPRRLEKAFGGSGTINDSGHGS